MEFERKEYIVTNEEGLTDQEIRYIEAIANNERPPQGTSDALITLRAKTGAANVGSLMLKLLKDGVIKSLCVVLALGCIIGPDNTLRPARLSRTTARSCARIYS